MGMGLEETTVFSPSFDANGLIPAIIVDETGVRMFAHMNSEALALTISTGQVHFWSRSRGRIWKKGETSGETMVVLEILTDCDQDALVIRVRVEGRGAACHTGRSSCFYRRLDDGKLVFTGDQRLFDPAEVYKDRS